MLIVVLEHALVPGLPPARHMISEYANSDAGALMIAGFLSWAVSLAATAALARDALDSSHQIAYSVLLLFLVAAAVGVLVSACFSTQTIAGAVPTGARLTATGRLHDLGSGVATLALFGAAIASTRAIDTVPRFRVWVCAAVVLGVACDAGLLAVGQEVGGLRQRVLVVIACAWQASLIGVLRSSRIARQPAGRGAVGGGAVANQMDH